MRRRKLKRNPQDKRLRLETLEPRLLLAVDGFRTITGEGNNIANPTWGEADTPLVRLMSSDYADGLSAPSGGDRPSARAVSNAVIAQNSDIPNGRFLTDFVWAWGQFIDHDIGLTEPGEPHEPFPIPVPTGDPFFDPAGSGQQTIDLNRSIFDPQSGITSPREQLNEISAYIDASNVYGSDLVRAGALRTMSAGLLKTSAGDLLPFNVDGLPNAMGTSSSFFLAGDVRANENVVLTAMHTLFVREHNRVATELANGEYSGQDLSDPAVDEEIYQRARQYVGGLMQSITYNEFLPALLGAGAVPAYANDGYDPNVNPSALNEFTTAAFRVGHTMLSSDLQQADANGPTGSVPLLDAFFNPELVEQEGIDSFLQGAATQLMQEVDSFVIDDVRNFLFGPPGAGGFDLASLNIQRGRDHALPGYNEARNAMGLSTVQSFADISSDPNVVARLQSVYANVDDIDFWVGGLAEDHLSGSSLGPLFTTVMEEQYFRLRVGDRFYYERALTPVQAAEISNTQLSDVIHRNSDAVDLQENVFFADSVLYYRPDVGSGIDQLNVAVRGDQVEVTDRFGNVLESRPVGEVASLVLEGPVSGEDVDLHLDFSTLPNVPVSLGRFHLVSLEHSATERHYEITSNRVIVDGQQTLSVKSIGHVAVDGVVSETRAIAAAGEHGPLSVSVHDGAGGIAYLMHSQEPVAERFSNAPPVAADADHLVVVFYINGQWHYDNNQTLLPFLPRSTDTLLAELDLDQGSVLSLANLAGEVDGIQGGFFGDIDVSLHLALNSGEVAVTLGELDFGTFAVDAFRTIDGSRNNQANPQWGETHEQLVRLADAAYGDGISTPAGADRPSARVISNEVIAQSDLIPNDRELTNFVWMWGQFIDHDLDLTEPIKPEEPFDIAVPLGDPFFDPFGTGVATIPLDRAIYDLDTGLTGPREQINEITSFIDASSVYGSEEERATALRTMSAGRLDTSAGDLLPFNANGLPNAMGTSETFFLAGDVRANENVLLTAMHTIFVREHNRVADELAATEFAGADLSDPDVDEAIYQRARQHVGALLQAITYNEFLPAVLGPGAVETYDEAGGYDYRANPNIANEFSAAAFRFGHTMLTSDLNQGDSSGAFTGSVRLLDAFFNPSLVTSESIDSFLNGAANQLMQDVDPFVVDDVRNFLFGPPGAGGFDLPSLNIQRGRDHGLPSYNAGRIALGLAPKASFNEVSSDPAVVSRLAAAYDSVDDIDFWVGGLAEDHLLGSSLGELFTHVLQDQFHRTRAGDRFYYENSLSPAMVEDISNTRLSDVIQRNTQVGELQDNLFYTASTFYYRPEAGASVGAVQLAVADELLQLTDANGTVLQQQSLSTVSSVVIEGPVDGAAVELQLDVPSLAAIRVPISVGGLSHVSLYGLTDQDRFENTGDAVRINGHVIPTLNVDHVSMASYDVEVSKVAVNRGAGTSHLGGGINAHDNAQGRGFIMYSSRPVADRFGSMQGGTSVHFMAVTYEYGQWQFDNNGTMIPFAPSRGDVLVAELDFTANTARTLNSQFGQHNGIAYGYLEGDLSVEAETYRGKYNAGEFTVYGSHFTRPMPTSSTVHVGDLQGGVGAIDSQTGQGYLMYSQQDVQTRFSRLPYMSEHIVPVIYTAGQWKYDATDQWMPFEPLDSDVLIAKTNFSADKVTSLEGQVGIVNGMHAGYVEGDLHFFADQFAGGYNEGEFQVMGTYFVAAKTKPANVLHYRADASVHEATLSVNNGYVALRDAAGNVLVQHAVDGLEQLIIDGSHLHLKVNVKELSSQPTPLSIGELSELTLEELSGMDRFRQTEAFIEINEQALPIGSVGKVNVDSMQIVASQIALNRGASSRHLGGGINAMDHAAGEGFILYSSRPLPDRFGTMQGGSSVHFIAVVYEDGQWKYDNGSALTPFSPERGDVLVAEVNFGTNHVTHLSGQFGARHGIQFGYLSGDIRIVAESYLSSYNAGEFTVYGDTFSRPMAAAQHVSIGNLRLGVGAIDDATGEGYLMYSKQKVQNRFSRLRYMSHNVVPVIYVDGQWKYDGTDQWMPFDPVDTDVLLAKVSYANDTVESLEGQVSVINGVNAGYVQGDLHFYADQFDGSYNEGEFQVTGSYFEAPKVALNDYSLGNLRRGIAGNDNGQGQAHILYSQENVITRFGEENIHANNARKLLLVFHDEGQWFVDSNGVSLPFVPLESDVIVADVDYDTSEVALLDYLTERHGVRAGFHDSDLEVIANQWGGIANPGEFEVRGSYLRTLH